MREGARRAADWAPDTRPGLPQPFALRGYRIRDVREACRARSALNSAANFLRALLNSASSSAVNCRQASAHDDVIFSVALKHFRKSWEVQTAHPISGTGVIYLDKRGKRHAAPLKIADLDS
jgi:hypothetical protein